MGKLNEIPAPIKVLYDRHNLSGMGGIKTNCKLFRTIDADVSERSCFGKDRFSLPDIVYILLLTLSSSLFLLEIFLGSKALNKVLFDLFFFAPASYFVAVPLKELFRVLAFKLLGAIQIVLSVNQKLELRCSAAIFSCKYKLALLIGLPLLLTNILLIFLYFLPGSHHFILSGSLIALNVLALNDMVLINESIQLESRNYYTYYTPEKEIHIFTALT